MDNDDRADIITLLAFITSVTVCNRGGSSTTWRMIRYVRSVLGLSDITESDTESLNNLTKLSNSQ